MRVPASRAGVQRRLHWFDVFWAAAAPAVALTAQGLDPHPLVPSSEQIVYYFLSLLAALWFFWSFRITEAAPSYFSASDGMEVVKVGCGATAAGTAVTFIFTRLDGVHGSTPLVSAVLLIAGLLAARTVIRFCASRGDDDGNAQAAEPENIILIGADRATQSFIRFLARCSSSETRVVAVLDDRRHLVGRSIARISIVGTPGALSDIIDEFAVHGVNITRVIVSGSHLDAGSIQSVLDVCGERGVACDTSANMAMRCMLSTKAQEEAVGAARAQIGLPQVYLILKRLVDVAVASTALVLVAPFLLAISLVIWIDIGAPVLFWQRRVGRNGKTFHLYKFRTLRAPFDRHGFRVGDAARLSPTGALLRTMHLDELPQLLNVINGDMSLVGPRPLLMIDQPRNPTVRLMVRPGMTGWAQLKGGKSITPNQKGELDDWYVQNLSPKIDARIILMTVMRVLQGGSSETWVGDASSAVVPFPEERLPSA